MTAHYTDLAALNEPYAQSFTQEKADLSILPKQSVIIVTCFDARVDPTLFLGLKEGDALILRNAGGAIRELVRSIVIGQQLTGFKELALFRHTHCGGNTFTTESMRDKIVAADPGSKELSEAADQFDWQGWTDIEATLKDDIAFLKEHPLIPNDTLITGWAFDVKTGKVNRVV
ncbi:carbonic anhydrase [Punctularia strigosozonata HHB-11173 SS5]|uniref:carbonic anhydrase n=1 Tax=Punctularia strigosozonata (strain HHB-11173) TaxID=741275 RepID=UPI000441650B|nr:carbonic anhydrase [Punctularia strigosozonata HHB-11173 SS5]EIN13366.1 carbonic anhydrase [Punctularia strigosozonata HHB-11173 SS5]